MQLFPILLVFLCDNIQLKKNAFVSLRVGKDVYLSKSMPDNSTLKISYPGFLVYKLEETAPAHFLVADKTVYIPCHSPPAKEGQLLFTAEVVENPYYTSRENIKISLFLANLTLLGLLFFRALAHLDQLA